MKNKNISIFCSIISAFSICMPLSSIYAEDNNTIYTSLTSSQQNQDHENMKINNISEPSSEEDSDSDSYLDEKTGKVIDPFVRPGMADLLHLNKSIEITYKKCFSLFCSKQKKIFYSNLIDHLFKISDYFKFASISTPYQENICNAQVIVSQMQELVNIMERNSKCISWSTRSTALKAMHTYFSAESIMPGIDFSTNEVGADDMANYLRSHFTNNDSLMNFIQGLSNRMEIFEAIIYYA